MVRLEILSEVRKDGVLTKNQGRFLGEGVVEIGRTKWSLSEHVRLGLLISSGDGRHGECIDDGGVTHLQ